MSKLHSIQRVGLVAVAAALALSFAVPTAADTIYLKNGRKIRSSEVRVEGDRVFFVQYGGEVVLSMSLVDRIVVDTSVEPEATPPPPPVVVSGAGPDDPAAADPGGDVAPDQTQDYWQDRIRTIETERAQVELQIEDLRRTERAFLFSKRSTAETREHIDESQARLVELDKEMTDLQSEARRAGVPAGWLRLSGGGGTSG